MLLTACLWSYGDALTNQVTVLCMCLCPCLSLRMCLCLYLCPCMSLYLCPCMSLPSRASKSWDLGEVLTSGRLRLLKGLKGLGGSGHPATKPAWLQLGRLPSSLE